MPLELNRKETVFLETVSSLSQIICKKNDFFCFFAKQNLCASFLFLQKERYVNPYKFSTSLLDKKSLSFSKNSAVVNNIRLLNFSKEKLDKPGALKSIKFPKELFFLSKKLFKKHLVTNSEKNWFKFFHLRDKLLSRSEKDFLGPPAVVNNSRFPHALKSIRFPDLSLDKSDEPNFSLEKLDTPDVVNTIRLPDYRSRIRFPAKFPAFFFKMFVYSMLEFIVFESQTHLFYINRFYLKSKKLIFQKIVAKSWVNQNFHFFYLNLNSQTTFLGVSRNNNSQIYYSYFLSFLKKRQLLKKFLFMHNLIPQIENFLILSDYIPHLGQSIYDCIENLYQNFQQNPKFIIKQKLALNSVQLWQNRFNHFFLKEMRSSDYYQSNLNLLFKKSFLLAKSINLTNYFKNFLIKNDVKFNKSSFLLRGRENFFCYQKKDLFFLTSNDSSTNVPAVVNNSRVPFANLNWSKKQKSPILSRIELSQLTKSTPFFEVFQYLFQKTLFWNLVRNLSNHISRTIFISFLTIFKKRKNSLKPEFGKSQKFKPIFKPLLQHFTFHFSFNEIIGFQKLLQNSIIQHNNSFLYITPKRNLLLVPFQYIKVWYEKHGFCFSETKLCHSYFSLLKNNAGLSFAGFSLIQRRNYRIQSKLWQNFQIYLNSFYLISSFCNLNKEFFVYLKLNKDFSAFKKKLNYFIKMVLKNRIKQSILYVFPHFFTKMKRPCCSLEQQIPFLYLKNKNREITTDFNEFSLKKSFTLNMFHSQFYKKTLLNLTPFLQKKYFDTEILPSKSSLIFYLNEIKQIIRTLKAKSQDFLIHTLTPYIHNWSFYYKIISHARVLSLCDNVVFKCLWRWACRKHPNKSRKWVKNKYYFNNINNKKSLNWNFCAYNSERNYINCLPKHCSVKLIRHLKVYQHISLYSENWKYWLPYFFSKEKLNKSNGVHNIR